WDDPHNVDPAFQRARLRREVLPLLDDVLQGGVAEALARTADLLRDDLAALDGYAADFLARPSVGRPQHDAAEQESTGDPDVAALDPLPRAVRRRVLRIWAQQAGAMPLTAERTKALDALVTDWHGQRAVDLPGGIAVRRESAKLVAYPHRRGAS